MTEATPSTPILSFDSPTRALVRLAARIAAGSEEQVRAALRDAQDAATPAPWVEELILQSYLFCGFPRTLNAAREWRRLDASQGRGEGATEEVAGYAEHQEAGEATCARVYGRFYTKLRQNIVALHPELDRWMIVEGYGKVLSRPALDLGRRELCIVAACLASAQDRQLHSHLHGCRNVGVPDAVVGQALEALAGAVDAEGLERGRAMWVKVRGQ